MAGPPTRDLEVPAAPAGPKSTSTAPCPICLERMVHEVVALGCGHLFHERCLVGPALRNCALCRVPVRPDRIKPASLLPGVDRSRSGTVATNFTLRSVAPPAPALLQAALPSAVRPAPPPQVLPPPPPQMLPRPPPQLLQAFVPPAVTSSMPQPLLDLLAAWQAEAMARVPHAAAAAAAAAPVAGQAAAGGAGVAAAAATAAAHAVAATAAAHAARHAAANAAAAASVPSPTNHRADDPESPSTHNSGSRTATDIPAAESAALLEGIMLQLGAAAAADPSAAPGDARHMLPASQRDLLRQLQQQQQQQRWPSQPLQADRQQQQENRQQGQQPRQQQDGLCPPSTFAFCIDISSSMGSSRAWQPAGVSRLCFALATLACMVDSQVAVGDWVSVTAFDSESATVKRWFCKPASFDKRAFLAECTGAVRHCGLRRWGTRLCTAVCHAVSDQAAQAQALSVTAPSLHTAPRLAVPAPCRPPGLGPYGAAEARGDPSSQPGSAVHSFVVLTDGDADDGSTAFDDAAALLRDPPFADGGFRALLMHIDYRHGRNSDWLRRLAQCSDGARLPYVELVELALPARLNLSSIHSAGSSVLSAAGSGAALQGQPPAGGGSGAFVSELLARQRAAAVAGLDPTGWQARVAAGADHHRAENDDSMPVRAMSQAIHRFSSRLGSAPSMRSFRGGDPWEPAASPAVGSDASAVAPGGLDP